VVTVPQGDVLSPGRLDGLELQGCALLLKTGAGGTECSGGHLAAETARMAVESGVMTVGTDAMSVDAPDSAGVHGILLESSVLILENLLLDQVEDGRYLLLCFPLRIRDGDGSPVRAFLHPLR
jgi:kynurenine formamidase